MHFFFYGTLRTGLWNNRLLAKSKLVGLGRTVDPFSLWVTPYGLPYVLKQPAHGPVVGEIWDVDGQAQVHIIRMERQSGYSMITANVCPDSRPDENQTCLMFLGSELMGDNNIHVQSGDFTSIKFTRRAFQI